MAKLPGISAFVFALVLAPLTYTDRAAAQTGSVPVDLTRSSSGLTDENALLRLHGVPAKEQDSKNELLVRSPALVVGPVMEGVGQPRLCRWRHEMLGQRVQVEGLALGKPPLKPSMMTRQRVVYEGGMIFIKGTDFLKAGAAGRTVRVTGKLRLDPASVMEFSGHESIKVNQYYYIDAESVEALERVTEPYLVAPALRREGDG